MITQVLHCPYCHETDIVRHGKSPEGKQRYRCRQCLEGRGRTFLLEYAYAGQSLAVKQQIVDMAMNASGIRDTARVLHVSPTTVLKELKKTRVANSAGVTAPPASRDRSPDPDESADAASAGGGESPERGAALARH
jgi:transposase-like protein